MKYFSAIFAVLNYHRLVNAMVTNHNMQLPINSVEDRILALNVTPLCLEHTQHWIAELQHGVPWALKMLDSYTKLPTGVHLGSRNQLGMFDECVNIKVKDNEVQFHGQYCRALTDLKFPNNIIQRSLMMNAFCVPSSCEPEEVATLLNEYIGPELGIQITVVLLVPRDCHIKESISTIPTGAAIFLVFLVLLLGIYMICALIEWRQGKQASALVRACSLTSTCRSLFSIRKHPSDISCLHGLRVGSILWIIVGHRYLQEQYLPLSNSDVFHNFFRGKTSMTIGNGMLAVDTFFFLSGFLICASFLQQMQKQRQVFDVLQFYLYRYIRIAIPIGVVIIFYITISTWIGDGPLWNNYFYFESRNCKALWWTNMLFINNYINRKEDFFACIGITWYTAVDMQLAWLSPLVLLPLYYSRRAGLQLMTLLILISCFIPFAVTYIYMFPMAPLQIVIDIPNENAPVGDINFLMYMPTHTRATPYLCGILFGYILFKKLKNTNFKIKKIYVYMGWTLCTAVSLTIVYSLSIAYQPDYVYDVVGSAFYAGFHRLGWSAVLSWIIFACINGNGGIANIILSWRYLLPLSKLTYGAYLLHFILINYENATTRNQTYVSNFNVVHKFFGDLLPVYLMSAMLYILFEGPVMSILRIWFKKSKTTKGKEIIKKN